MPYILRITQRYLVKDRTAFMDLEARFAAMEQERSDFVKGRRRQPCLGRLPSNTLIWESEFPTLADAQAAMAKLGSDPEHADLFRQQDAYITDAWMEIDEVLEFEPAE